MEIDNIMDALALKDVSSIIQYCSCKYNDETVEFRLVNDEFGVIDDIEFETEGGEWDLEFAGELNDDVQMILDAIENAPYEVFHKSDVGSTLKLNHESIKPQNLPDHFKTDFYVDENDGQIIFSLIKNIVELD